MESCKTLLHCVHPQTLLVHYSGFHSKIVKFVGNAIANSKKRTTGHRFIQPLYPFLIM